MQPVLAETTPADWVIVIGALTTMATSIIAAIAALLSNKKATTIQESVNGTTTRMMDRNVQLSNTLANNGVAIPAPPIPDAVPNPGN